MDITEAENNKGESAIFTRTRQKVTIRGTHYHLVKVIFNNGEEKLVSPSLLNLE